MLYMEHVITVRHVVHGACKCTTCTVEHVIPLQHVVRHGACTLQHVVQRGTFGNSIHVSGYYF